MRTIQIDAANCTRTDNGKYVIEASDVLRVTDELPTAVLLNIDGTEVTVRYWMTDKDNEGEVMAWLYAGPVDLTILND